MYLYSLDLFELNQMYRWTLIRGTNSCWVESICYPQSYIRVCFFFLKHIHFFVCMHHIAFWNISSCTQITRLCIWSPDYRISLTNWGQYSLLTPVSFFHKSMFICVTLSSKLSTSFHNTSLVVNWSGCQNSLRKKTRFHQQILSQICKI